jgi:hypothetical protein
MGHAVFLRLANGATVRGMKSDALPRNSAPAAANSGLPRAFNTTIFTSQKNSLFQFFIGKLSANKAH